jgi:hypothetical protein
MTLFVTMARVGSEELVLETRTRRLVGEPLHLEFDDVFSSNEKIYFPKNRCEQNKGPGLRVST